MSQTQKVAIVTGASSGIGRATALAFGREGYAVVAVGRQQMALDAVVAEVAAAAGCAEALTADVTARDSPDRIVSPPSAPGRHEGLLRELSQVHALSDERMRRIREISRLRARSARETRR